MNQVQLLSRRDLLAQGMAVSALAIWPGWMPRLAFSRNGARGDVLVCVFLRGGADGLNVIVPHGDEAYYGARPTLGLARPDDNKADAKNRSLDLDGFFGLHPSLAPLLPLFQAHQALAVHATGSPDPTRSHFDAMSFMERGTPGSNSLGTGWLARHLDTLDTGNNSAVRAVGWGTALQQSLRGPVSAVSLKSIVDYHLGGRKDEADQMLTALNALYAAGPDPLKTPDQQTVDILDLVKKINVSAYKPANGAQYNTKTDFDLALMQTATLIKADVGLEVAAIDLGGWDTHQNEGAEIAADLTALANGLATFAADMGDAMKHITVVTMSEFGRRVQENASGGTDHGHGNVMLLMGGHVAPKPVIAQWPGLAPEKLDQGDLAITIDYRDVLSEILVNRLNNDQIDQIFPDFKPTPRGIVTPGA